MNCTSIIILTYNNLTYTKLCIESIRNFTSVGSYEVIVVDNHSTDGSVEWLKEQTDIQLITNGENMGFPAGCNQGIQAAKKENDILLLNNDTIVTPSWLENLQACLHSDPSIGAVGPLTDACSNLQQISVSYKDFSDLLHFAMAFNSSDSRKWEDRIRLIGFCLLIKRGVLNQVGLLDERFGKGNYEDDDYSTRVHKAGFRLQLCGDCFIHHFGSGSFSKDVASFRGHLEKNRRVFAAKWGFDPYLLAIDERQSLQPYLQELATPDSVLVANCMFGAIPYYLRRLYPHAQIEGMEPNDVYGTIPVNGINRVTSEGALLAHHYNLVILLNHPWDKLSADPERLADLVDDGGTLMLMENKNVDLSAFGSGWKMQDQGGTILLQKLEERAKPEPLDIQGINGSALAGMDFSLPDEPSDPLVLAFLLRRIENNIEVEENQNRVFLLLESNAISIGQFKQTVLNETIEKAAVFNTQGALFYNDGNAAVALNLFIEAFKLDSQNRDVVFNLAYALAELGKREDAKNVLDVYKGSDTEFEELRKALQ